MYWTYGSPLQPAFANEVLTFPQVYDLAMDKGCRYASSGDPTAIRLAITSGIDRDISYRPIPGIEWGDHPLLVYAAAYGGQCSELAYLERGLLRSIGIDANVMYHWGGAKPNTLLLYRYSGGSGSFQIIEGVHDDAPANPHFSFHAVVNSGTLILDPSYGRSRPSVDFAETACQSTYPHQISLFPWTSEVDTGCQCSH